MVKPKQKILRDGTISYRIFVNGYNPNTDKNDKNYSETWRVPEGLTPKEVERELTKEILRFGDEISKKYFKGSTYCPKHRETLVEFARKQLRKKVNSGRIAKTSEVRFESVIDYLEKKFGDIALEDFNSTHIELMLDELQEKEIQRKKAVLKRDIDKLIQDKFGLLLTFRQEAKVSETALLQARRREHIDYTTAEKICSALGVSLSTYFEVLHDEPQYYKLSSLKKYFSVLSSILSSAKKKHLIVENYASNDYTELKVDKKNRVKKDWVYDYEQYIEVLDIIHKDQVFKEWQKMVFQLELLLGTRRGETLALRWNDIDFENKIITIDSEMLYTPKHGIYERHCTKNGDIRDFIAAERVFALLKEYKEYWDKNLKNRKNDTLLFINDDGSIPNPTSTEKILSKFFDRNPQLKRLSQHKFRHTYISLLIAKGVPVTNVAKFVGHNDVSTTLDNYAHFIPSTDRICAETINKMII